MIPSTMELVFVRFLTPREVRGAGRLQFLQSCVFWNINPAHKMSDSGTLPQVHVLGFERAADEGAGIVAQEIESALASSLAADLEWIHAEIRRQWRVPDGQQENWLGCCS